MGGIQLTDDSPVHGDPVHYDHTDDDDDDDGQGELESSAFAALNADKLKTFDGVFVPTVSYRGNVEDFIIPLHRR